MEAERQPGWEGALRPAARARGAADGPVPGTRTWARRAAGHRVGPTPCPRASACVGGTEFPGAGDAGSERTLGGLPGRRPRRASRGPAGRPQVRVWGRWAGHPAARRTAHRPVTHGEQFQPSGVEGAVAAVTIHFGGSFQNAGWALI